MDEKKPVYKRVLIKISGEALAGDKKSGLDFGVISSVCEAVKKCLLLRLKAAHGIGAASRSGNPAGLLKDPVLGKPADALIWNGRPAP